MKVSWYTLLALLGVTIDFRCTKFLLKGGVVILAYKKFNRKGYKKTARKQKSSYTELERMSYKLGMIKRGLNNPDSRVYESFVNGCNGVTTKKKKSLI